MPKKITNEYVWHRQQLRKQMSEFLIKTKYRREDTGEKQTGYDWTEHFKAMRLKQPKQYLENN